MKLLADTSALLALVMRNDQHHRAAVAFLRGRPEARFVLSELIFSELVTRVRARATAAVAVDLATGLLHSRRFQMLVVDEDVLGGALERMRRFADKRLSLTDCASFALMERLGLEAAFTFDRDFRECGYRMVP